MPVGIKLDNLTNDFVVQDGTIATVNDGEKLAQDIKTRLKTLRGEVVLDNEYGFPYIDLFETKKINLSEVETLIKQFIVDTDGVQSITEFFMDYERGNSRTVTVVFSVKAEAAYLLSNVQVTI